MAKVETINDLMEAAKDHLLTATAISDIEDKAKQDKRLEKTLKVIRDALTETYNAGGKDFGVSEATVVSITENIYNNQESGAAEPNKVHYTGGSSATVTVHFQNEVIRNAEAELEKSFAKSDKASEKMDETGVAQRIRDDYATKFAEAENFADRLKVVKEFEKEATAYKEEVDKIAGSYKASAAPQMHSKAVEIADALIEAINGKTALDAIDKPNNVEIAEQKDREEAVRKLYDAATKDTDDSKAPFKNTSKKGEEKRKEVFDHIVAATVTARIAGNDTLEEGLAAIAKEVGDVGKIATKSVAVEAQRSGRSTSVSSNDKSNDLFAKIALTAAAAGGAYLGATGANETTAATATEPEKKKMNIVKVAVGAIVTAAALLTLFKGKDPDLGKRAQEAFNSFGKGAARA